MNERVDAARVLAIGLALITVVTSSSGCKTPDDGQQGDTVDNASAQGAEALTQLLETDTESLVSTVETLRDRSFEKPPSWRAKTGPLETDAGEVQNSDERALISRMLFDLEKAPAALPSPAFERIARYDAADHTIVFRKDASDAEALEFAVVVALVDALESQHFDFSTESSTMDGRLAGDAGARSGEMLAAAAYLLRQRDDLSLRTFARRPALSLQLSPLGDDLRRERGRKPTPVESPDDLAKRLRTFTLREGLTLGAALFRSNGWSGVELLDSFGPESTADVVRSDRWMDGSGLGTWSWPETSSWNDAHPVEAEGRIGPAMTAIWLGQVFRPDLARTVYSGWRSDAYRYGTYDSEGDEGTAWRFEWVMQWDSPSSSREIAAAFEKVLGKHYATAAGGGDEVTYQVARKGLKVGVLLESAATPAPDDLPDDATYLVSSTVKYHQREALPTSFEPTRAEEFRQAARQANLEKQETQTWTDPASGLSANLSAVSDWTIRTSQTLPLRWFAKRGDGFVLQLTTELVNPLGPSFGTDSYRENLQTAFTSSLKDASFEHEGETDQPVPQTLRFGVDGSKTGRDWRLEAWQIKHGDVIATLSLQGPASGFDAWLAPAKKVAASIERITDTPPGTADDTSSDSEGSIEYEIEDN